MCWPADGILKMYISQGYITKCPIIPHDINQANSFYGVAPSLAQGKMIAPTQLANPAFQVQSSDLSYTGSTCIKLYVDIFYVNGLFFFHTKSKDTNIITIHHLQNQQNSRIIKTSKHIISKYTTHRFIITDVFADNEIDQDNLHYLALPAKMYIYTQDKHVPIIECSICTVRERVWSIC